MSNFIKDKRGIVVSANKPFNGSSLRIIKSFAFQSEYCYERIMTDESEYKELLTEFEYKQKSETVEDKRINAFFWSKFGPVSIGENWR